MKEIVITQLSLTIYEMEGFDYKLAVVRNSNQGCNLFLLKDGRFDFIIGLSHKDGSDLTEEDILSNVILYFEVEHAISNQNTINKAVV